MPDAESPPPPQTLSGKVVAGAGWNGLSAVLRQIFSLACTGILAQILDPGVYGLMFMAGVIILFLVNFRDLGTSTAIIQRREVSGRLLSSIFWLNCAVGLAFSLLMFGAATPLGAFFREPRLPELVRALSITFLIASAGSVQNALLTRTMAFRAIAVADVLSTVGGYVVAITSALMGLGVWSLVLSNLANTIISTVAYWWFAEWSPTFEFHPSDVRSIAGFSLNFSGYGLAHYFARNADNIVVGRFLGKESLGIYQMAYNLMLYPIQNISAVIGQVLLPAFSQVQGDDVRFRSAYIRASMLIGLVTFPVMVGMAVLADPLVRAVLGHKWLPVIPLFQILAPVGLLQSVQGVAAHIYIVKGRTDWLLRWAIGASVVYVCGFLIGARYGVRGVAISYVITNLGILLFPSFAIPFRLIGLPFGHFARSFLPQGAITLAMAVTCVGWIAGLRHFSIASPWAILTSTALVGLIVYVFLMVRIRPAVVLHLEDVMKDSRNGIAGRCMKVVGLFPG